MSIILWIVIGAISGWIASVITRSSYGIFGDIVIGIVGALLGGFLMSLFGQSGVTGFNFYSLVVSILGAVILLWLFKAIRGGSTRGV